MIKTRLTSFLLFSKEKFNIYNELERLNKILFYHNPSNQLFNREIPSTFSWRFLLGMMSEWVIQSYAYNPKSSSKV